MKIISRVFRLIRINYVLAKYNIDEIILGHHSVLRYLVYFNPWSWTTEKLSRGVRIRHALEELGPIFVKAGQILSTRRDILPDDIAEELCKLQDRVPPFPGKIARQVIEKALERPIDSVFATLDIEALASASIAQVHAATLLEGQSVVVKVLRPNIRAIIDSDIDLLMLLARFAQRYWFRFRHFKVEEVIAEIAQTLHDELDLLREGANASQLRRNFMHSTALYIPTVYWTHSRTNILVMERIHGIPIHDVPALKASGVDLKKLAQQGIEIFFTQIFRDSFFHADLHPGNLFISVKNPENPQYIAVDFGIVGSLSHNDKRYIAENMVAFFKRDYQRVAELHIACGWLPPDTRIDQFEGAIRAVSEPIFEKPLNEISFGQLLLRLFQVARHYHIKIQPQLILLQKTLVSIEGLSRQLSPNLDLWTTGTPHLERWLKKQVGFRAFLHRVKENLPLWSEQLPELPNLLYEMVKDKKQQQERNRFEQSLQGSETSITTHKFHWLSFLIGVVVAGVICIVVAISST